MLSRVAVSAALAVGLIGFAGCGPAKLDVTKSYSMETGDTNAIDLPPQSKPQKITAAFDSPDAEVDVYIFDAKDAGELEKLSKDKALGSAKKAKSGVVTANLPANTAGRVVVAHAGGKKGDVKVNVSNQK